MHRAELLATAWRYTFGGQRAQLSTFMSRLCLLGLVLAISLLLTVLSVMNGFDREMRERILSLVPHISVRAAIQPDPQIWETLLEDLRQHPDVLRASPFIAFEALLLRGQQAEAVSGLALRAEAIDEFAHMLRAGTLVDLHEDPQGLLLGSELAAQVGAAPGERLTLVLPPAPGSTPFRNGAGAARSLVFTLRGVLHTGTELDRTLAIIGLDSEIGAADTSIMRGLRLHVSDLFEVAQTSRALLPLLPPGFYLTDWTMTHGNLYAAIQLSRRLISLLLLSIIGVAAFNLVSSLVLVVIDKREDIAILRALGARPATIAQLFLLQGALVGVFGSLLGCLGGALFSWLVPRVVSALGWQLLSTEVYPVSFIPVDLRLLDFLLVGGAAVVLCLLAAVYPALRAARLAPARVLQGAD